MNVEQYISSGILEAYLLGELSEQECAAVERNLAQYPQLREELKHAEALQEKFLMQTAMAPPASVKTLLFEKIDQQKQNAKIISKSSQTRSISVWKYAVAASVTIALISSYLAFDYHNKWKHSENSLTEIIAQNQRVAKDYNTVNQRLDKIENDLRVIDNPAFTRVIMNGTDNAPSAIAYVYWNEKNKEVYLSVQRMNELSTENQYQLWAIIDGKPVDAGVFDSGVAGLLKMKDITKGAATFTVTIEPRGGKTSPSLETMQVVGNVVKG